MKTRLESKVNFISTEGGTVNFCQFMGWDKYYEKIDHTTPQRFPDITRCCAKKWTWKCCYKKLIFSVMHMDFSKSDICQSAMTL